MAKIANVALTSTFDTWRTSSNQAFDRLSQFAINNSSLYANTITANNVLRSSGNTVLGAAGKRAIVTGLLSANGRVTVGTNLAVSGNTSLSALTTSSALTYGGVTLNNAVTGTGNMVLSSSPTLVTPDLGTPASANLTNATGLPISTGVSGLGINVATFLATPSAANLASAVPDETGSGALVFATSPTLVTPALGTPASGIVTNLTGTASININGTVGATTAAAGSFTTLTTSSTVTHNGGTVNGVPYLNGSKVLTTGSALTFDGTNFAASNQIIAGIGVATANVIARSNVANGGAGYSQFLFGNASGDTRGYLSYSHASEALLFGIASSEQMRLTSTGLGIGTSSPGAKLHVVGNAYVQSGAIFADALTSYGGTSLALNGGSSLIALTSGTERMRLDASGNLGIATSSPLAKLDVKGGTTIASLTDWNSKSNSMFELANPAVRFGIGYDSSDQVLLQAFDSSNDSRSLALQVYGGNLGIGTSSPAYKLDVNGTFGVSGAVTLSAGTANGVPYLNGSKVLTTGSALTFDGSQLGVNKAAGSLLATIHAFAAGGSSLRLDRTGAGTSTIISVESGVAYRDLTIDAANSIFSIAGSEAMRLDSSGNLGLGVTPSAWDSGWKAIDVSTVSSYTGSATGTDIWNNARVTGATPLYKTTAAASFYRQSAGAHYWFNAASGTAGNAISFTQAMTLDASGRLVVGATSTAAKFQVSGVSANTYLLIDNAAGGENYFAANISNIFQTAGTERARIDSSGNLLVGTTTTVVGSNHIVVGSNSIQGIKNDFTNLGTSAQSFGFQASSGGVYVASMKSIGGASIAFLVACTFDNSGINMFTTSLGGCTAGGVSGTISGINNDARTYTFSRNGGTGLLEVTASSTATGTTTFYLTPLNVFA